MTDAELFRSFYSPQLFRAQGHALIDQLAEYLEKVIPSDGTPALPVLPPRAASEVLADWSASLSLEPIVEREPGEPAALERLRTLVARLLADSNHLHHPRYVGHQATPPLPLAALCEMIAALLNNDMAIFELGPAATAIERALLRLLSRKLGLAAGSDGVLTSGGSLGNLTGLLTARQQVARDGLPLAVLVSEQVHYSVIRAVHLMGLGAEAIVPVPVDADHRLRVAALPDALREAARRGRRPFCVVATAGTTVTGAFDPLPEIAAFCARNALWLHVDAAHGGAAAFSERYRPLLSGIELADSVVCDGHKLLLMPAPLTALLFRNGQHSFTTFKQDAAYLLEKDSSADPWLDVAARTVECTKQMMGLKLYICLSCYGPRIFDEHVTRTFDLTRRFAQLLRASQDFEVPVMPSANILCFRYRPAGAGDLDILQENVRRKILASGEFYLVKAPVGGETYLRITVSNPLTTEADLHALVAAIRKAAAPDASSEFTQQEAGVELLRAPECRS
ncbi:pyridoxal phosphate-dependent decarboxylase family protein [Sorangium sp. So ce1128]